ncbi:hypothetical protein [Campylobacter mucosalis]|uniref:hypothetical protein n=1 Tax=Campylobacter mucosalis TaxID=202 RepID=UPI0014703DE0|nr:hypothetical protein [Campylobacter mucosalis]
MLRAVTRIYNHLFNPSSIIELNVIPNALDMAKYGILKTERNMKATIIAYENLLEQYPDKRPLFVFENSTQCEHTSEHASSGEYYFDMQKQPDGEVAKFEHILSILNAKDTQLSEFYSKINLNKGEKIKLLSELTYNDAKFLDEEIDVYLCHTTKPYECFARMLNGYFIDDMQPHQTYALIKFMYKFGYDFIGIGATLLMFYAKHSPNDATQLYSELAKVYGVSTQQMQNALEFCVNTKNYLILPYTNDALNF